MMLTKIMVHNDWCMFYFEFMSLNHKQIFCRHLKQLCRFAVQKHLKIGQRDNPVAILESSNLPLPVPLIQYCSVKMF